MLCPANTIAGRGLYRCKKEIVMKSKTFQVSKYGFTSSEDALKMYTKMYIVATNTYLSREDFEKKKVSSDTIVIYADKGNKNVLIKT